MRINPEVIAEVEAKLSALPESAYSAEVQAQLTRLYAEYAKCLKEAAKHEDTYGSDSGWNCRAAARAREIKNILWTFKPEAPPVVVQDGRCTYKVPGGRIQAQAWIERARKWKGVPAKANRWVGL